MLINLVNKPGEMLAGSWIISFHSVSHSFSDSLSVRVIMKHEEPGGSACLGSCGHEFSHFSGGLDSPHCERQPLCDV